ncbi:EutP/PduV family microcompartment system protein [Aminipila sp.]|uniref:EutP/PduV family microcompartment system protein n=1 Tax=Aminipila sp. TaxID=2060095 RepID=UPI00289ED59B|nr:EutP/PduV family microcompartment system protein [Aminipila sp.]
MKKKRVMVIGPTRCGKTTLVNELNNYDGPLRKTQDTIYGEKTIDIPSSYVAIPWMYKHLIATAQNAASHILLLVDQSNPVEIYSPGFAKVFRCPVIGVISKCDLKPENEEVCLRQLKQIGVSEPYFKISVPEGIGIEALKEYIFNTDKT